jgi:hypothetical protein
MDQNRELLIDLTSPLPAFTAQEVRQWAAGRKVFISSTMIDLQTERKQTATTIREVGADPRFFEGFSTPSDPASVYVPEVSRADLVVLLLGERYGAPIASMGNRSATHIEYDAAAEALKPLLIYRKEADGLTREPRLESFIRELEAKHVVARFHSLEQLEELAREGLTRRAQADSLTWVKLGRAVFPALEWHQDGANMHIRSATRDAQIVSYLKSLTQGFHQREVLILGTEVLLSSKVSLREEGRGRFQRELMLEVTIQRDQVGQPQRFAAHTFTQLGSINGVPGHELVQAYVRSMLFGEPMPDTHRSWLGRREAERPTFHLPELYAQLRDHQRVDELFPSLGRIYLVDRLVRGSGQEGGVTRDIRRLELSPVYDGKTYIHLEYAVASQYATDPVVDRVEGFIELEKPQQRRAITDWGG